jgi:DNA-binding SARP family transcriptional activator
MIELRALGTVEIQTDSATLTPSQEIVFAAALYLILERGSPVSRTRLASLLWPKGAEKIRAHRLRQTLLQLKKLGFPLSVDRNTVQLRKNEVRRDTDAMADAVPARTVNEQSVEFLPGYGPSFSAPFKDWIETTRNEFQSSIIALLVHELAGARLRGDWQAVERIAASCLLLDPFNEEAVLAKAEAAAMRGSKRKAVSILDRYIAEIGDATPDLRLPATVLRRRVVERVPDRPALLNIDPAFVGREPEMAAVSRAFERARTGNGSAILLVGEPGIGKSRLSAELARFAELRGARVQRTSCRRADIDRPMSLFVDIVPQLREMPGAIGCTPETFAWLRRLTEFEQGSDVSSRASDSQMLFENVRAALFDLLESIVEEHCLVLVIEDLQWLDKASAKLLVRMVEWSDKRRVLFLLNTRPGTNAFLDYAEKVPVDTIALGPLAPMPSTALLKSVALRPGDEPESGFVQWCLAVAEGNPFFLQELAHQWIETGHRYEAPPSVNKVLQERLSRLSSEALQVLQTCAVLNDYATLDRVQRVLEHHPHQLLAAIEELSKAAMLRIYPENTETTDRIQPRHDFLSSAAIGRLSAISLSFLHRRSADILERELAHHNVSATLLWACATHRHEAGDRGRALSLRMSCAEHLLELGLARDACAAYQKTMDYCATDSERLKVSSRLARAFELDGEWKQSIDKLRLCTSLIAKTDPSQSQHNDFELQILNARHRSALDFTRLLDETLNCVDSESASPRHRVGAAVLAMKLSVDCGRSDHLDAVYRRVSPFLHGPDVGELESLQIETIYKTMRGEDLVPVTDLQHLADVSRRTDGEFGYSLGLLMAASACRLSARYQEGLNFVAQALQHATANRLHARCREIKLHGIALHMAARAFDKAEEDLALVSSYPSSSDSAKERNEIHAHAARLALEHGDYTRAADAFGQIGPVSPNYSVSRKGFYLALELRIRIREGANNDILHRLVTELEATYSQMCGVGSQDFECYSLFLGLCQLNERDRAFSLLKKHVAVRRPKWPLSNEIVEAINGRIENWQPTSHQRLVTSQPQETAALSTVPRSGVL